MEVEPPEKYLQDILDEIGRIGIFTKNIRTLDDFSLDEKTQYACIHSIEIIGEAAKHVPDEFRRKHPQVAWADMAGMRDKLAHDYGGVNLAVVWATIGEDLPELKKQISGILAKKK